MRLSEILLLSTLTHVNLTFDKFTLVNPIPIITELPQ